MNILARRAHGERAIWFGGICDNDECTGRVDIRIKTINE